MSRGWRAGATGITRVCISLLLLVLLRGAAFAGSWSAAGADSLDVSVMGFYPINSSRGIWDCCAYVAPDGHEYGLIGADSLHIVDLANPRAPVRAAVVAPLGSSYFVDVAVRGRYAYAAFRKGPILIIDLTNPRAPITRGAIPQSDFCACSCGYPCTNPNNAEIETIFIDERGVLYVTGIRCGEGIQMYDIATDPIHPQWLCHEHTFAGPGKSYYVHDVYVRDGILFVSRSQGIPGGDSLPRWDILDGDPLCPSSPDNCGGSLPAFISSFRHTGPELHSHSSFRLDDPRYLLSCDESENGHIRVWNIANLAHPTQVAEIHPENTCHSLHNVYVDGLIGYAAWYNHGIEVFDLYDPTHPARLGHYHHPTRWHDRPTDTCCDPTDGPSAQCYGVPHLDPFFPSGIFIATDIDQGMIVGRYHRVAVGVDEPRAPRAGTDELRVMSAPREVPVRLRYLGTGHPRVEIFSASGVRVARLDPRDGDTGVNYEWNGRVHGGEDAPTGIYFARAEGTESGRATSGAKIVLLRP